MPKHRKARPAPPPIPPEQETLSVAQAQRVLKLSKHRVRAGLSVLHPDGWIPSFREGRHIRISRAGLLAAMAARTAAQKSVAS